MKNALIILLCFCLVFIFGIFAGANCQKQETLNRAKSFGETDLYTYEQVEFIILSN